jgi:Protein of unknown function (DUF1203)
MFTIEAVPAHVAERLRAGATVVRVADESPGYPCRQCLRDAELNEELVLVSYDPFDTNSPYRCPGPIFLHREDCGDRLDPSAVPDQLARRRLSLRTFDGAAMMLDGRVVDGADLAAALDQLLVLPGADRVHIHNAGPGCFAATAVPA